MSFYNSFVIKPKLTAFIFYHVYTKKCNDFSRHDEICTDCKIVALGEERKLVYNGFAPAFFENSAAYTRKCLSIY